LARDRGGLRKEMPDLRGLVGGAPPRARCRASAPISVLLPPGRTTPPRPTAPPRRRHSRREGAPAA
jgi:hypothetical protein